MAERTKISGKALTANLRELAGQVVDIDQAGNPITREAALADLIWKQALGWTEKTRDDSGNAKEVVHKPVAWAQQFLYERLEGKAPPASPEGANGIKALDKIGDVVKDRVNAITQKLAARRSGPPTYSPGSRPKQAGDLAGVGAATEAGGTCPGSGPARSSGVADDSRGPGDGSSHHSGQEKRPVSA